KDWLSDSQSADLDPETAEGGGCEAQLCAMGGDGGFGDGQAKAAAVAARVGGTVEALAQFGQFVWRDADTVILDNQDGAVCLVFNGDPDGLVGMGDGIGQQIAEDQFKPCRHDMQGSLAANDLQTLVCIN